MLRDELKCFAVFVFWIFAYQALASLCKPKCRIPSAWLPVAKNVCYGTKNNAFGSFMVNRDCHLYKIRLSHVKGYQAASINKGSRWGDHSDYPGSFNTIVLKEKKLWCPERTDSFGNQVPKPDGFDINDDVIVLMKNDTLTVGTELQVAFGRDFVDHLYQNLSEGTHCVDIDFSCIV